MPSYKLYYFATRAKAEPIRYLFAEAGVEYEDIRYSFEDWPKHKQKMPFRQMPVLEVDGKQLSQTYAILRYLANEFGLGGKNKWEVAEADQISGAIDDLYLPIRPYFLEQDETIKAERLRKIKEDTSPNIFQALEAGLATSNSGFLVGDGLTYADFLLLGIQEFMDGTLKEESKNIYAAYPNIRRHREKIQSLPRIAAWIKKRPANDF